MAATVGTRKLVGHKECIESVFSSATGSLFSSSADGTVRMWDFRSRNSSIRMMRVPNGLDNVGFCREHDSLVCVSSGSNLYGYDLRFSSSIIVSEPNFSYNRADEDDEINDFSFSDDGSLLVVPSDSGQISVIATGSFTETASVAAHENIAAVGRFVPSGRQLVSGGYDCKLVGLKGNLEISRKISISSLIPVEEDETPGQVVNPAFAVCIDTSADQVGVGCGDGSVVVLNTRKGKMDFSRIAWGGSHVHASAVAGIAWDGDLVWSVGNDSVLIGMSETRIKVRYSLPWKPNGVAIVAPGKVAVAGMSRDMQILDFNS